MCVQATAYFFSLASSDVLAYDHCFDLIDQEPVLRQHGLPDALQGNMHLVLLQLLRLAKLVSVSSLGHISPDAVLS